MFSRPRLRYGKRNVVKRVARNTSMVCGQLSRSQNVESTALDF